MVASVGAPRSRLQTLAIVLLFSPAVTMWFLGRGRLGFLYLFGMMAWVAVTTWLSTTGIFHAVAGSFVHPITVVAVVAAGIPVIVGIVHAFRIREHSLKRPWYSRWFALVPICMFLMVTPDVVRALWLQPFNAPSGSMKPTLRVGDYFFVDKRAYGYGPYSVPYGIGPVIWDAPTSRTERRVPNRGDVAVFRLPSDTRTDYVKRVIGLSGDRVQIRDGRLFLNGVAVRTDPADKFIDEDFDGYERATTRLKETLPSGRSYFVLDARQTSFSDQTKEFVVPKGHLFVLGDNRDNSTDSRFQRDVGFIPLENLIGKVTRIFASRHPERILTSVE